MKKVNIFYGKCLPSMPYLITDLKTQDEEKGTSTKISIGEKPKRCKRLQQRQPLQRC